MRQIAREASVVGGEQGKRIVCSGRMWFTGVEAAPLSHRGGWHLAAPLPRCSAVHAGTARP